MNLNKQFSIKMKTMKTFRNFALLSLAAGMLAISCSKDSTNPSSTSLGVKMQATNKSFSLFKSTSLATPSFIWDSSFIIVSKIELEAEKQENDMSSDPSEVHFEWDGPVKIDLFRLNSVIGNITLQPGIYHEVSIKINSFNSDAGSLPDFYLSGTYTNTAGSVIPVEFTVNEDFEFRVKLEGSTLDAVNDYTSLINMNLTLLFAGIQSVDLDGATLSNGKIIISNSSNTSLYNKVIANLSSCGESHVSKGKGSDSNGSQGSDSGDSRGSNSGGGMNGSGGY
jgi:hypothetical protein